MHIPPAALSSNISPHRTRSKIIRTIMSWRQTFAEPYMSTKDPHLQRWTSNAAGGGMPVANDSRFVGVEETFQVGALRHAAALAEVDDTDKTSVSDRSERIRSSLAANCELVCLKTLVCTCILPRKTTKAKAWPKLLAEYTVHSASIMYHLAS
ncbi:hypothetical protein H257_13725 [Aphanomyces astaci]|uniref:Uncharacterized protein n=1 Tax=Aphanomyces astaci TaxID=112090 RepID=W4FU23_APHAT|nr:hypothetical protein H257_13725 [Aphanomyces astaci]ETV70995.1 hypothetical protein H257_13725 [Aphanomyces astaci]|eukprot:XP_009839658.1 hypothetical protein H257_13725 [Aphanomyces astaci]